MTAGGNAPMEFVLDREPVAREEEPAFDGALAAAGLDRAYWRAMNGLLTTSSRSDTPMALRAYRGGRLAGIAHLLECRRTNQCLFPNALGRALDVVPTPGYCWTRGDPGVDLLGSPGFVTEGEDAEAFYKQAIAFLNRRYTLGSVIEERDAVAAAPCYETPLMASGRYRVVAGGIDVLMAARGNLRRKVAKFRNKGGTLEVVAGTLSTRVRESVVQCVAQSANHGLLRAPFQENYVNMVRWAAEQAGPELVHVLARLDGEVVGYHAYLRSGSRLQCLSGGFDRTRHSTYHAYENILLETMRYAEGAGLAHVAFGPISNPSKAAVMPECVPFVVRFYSRFAVARRVLAAVVPKSALRPGNLAPYATLKGALDGMTAGGTRDEVARSGAPARACPAGAHAPQPGSAL